MLNSYPPQTQNYTKKQQTHAIVFQLFETGNQTSQKFTPSLSKLVPRLSKLVPSLLKLVPSLFEFSPF